MLNTTDFVLDFYRRPETEVRYCATAHYAETLLTNSVYVLNCSDANEALRKAQEYFEMFAAQAVICKTVVTIEILPKNASRWSNVTPEIIQNYPHTV